MSGYMALAEVSNSIVKILKDNLCPEPIAKQESIGVCMPGENGDYSLGVYLYNITEDGNLRLNQKQAIGSDHFKYPPMGLMLDYMITVYSKADPHTKSIDEQRILGSTLQTFHDNKRINEKYMEGNLAESQNPINVNFMNLSHDEKVRIWSMFNQPYKLSLFYQVGPIYIDSNKVKKTARVVDVDMSIVNIGKESTQ